jgi:hypothetical protein
MIDHTPPPCPVVVPDLRTTRPVVDGAAVDAAAAARNAIEAAYRAYIHAHIAPHRRLSVLSYGLVIARKSGPTAEETADLAMIDAIDAWESDCIAVRNARLAAIDTTETTWPAPPDGLAAWLAHF